MREPKLDKQCIHPYYISNNQQVVEGITLKQWYAGLAMWALIPTLDSSAQCAAKSIEYADELIKKLELE